MVERPRVASSVSINSATPSIEVPELRPRTRRERGSFWAPLLVDLEGIALET